MARESRVERSARRRRELAGYAAWLERKIAMKADHPLVAGWRRRLGETRRALRVLELQREIARLEAPEGQEPGRQEVHMPARRLAAEGRAAEG